MWAVAAAASAGGNRGSSGRGRAARSPGMLMGVCSPHVPAVVLAVHVEGLSSLVRLAIRLTPHWSGLA